MGVNMAEHILIENDLFKVSDRLKEIDADYFVMYNRKLRRFEVHNRRQRDTLALVVPHPVLDARTVTHTLKTRRENIDRLIREMEEANRKAAAIADKNILDNARGRLIDTLCRV